MAQTLRFDPIPPKKYEEYFILKFGSFVGTLLAGVVATGLWAATIRLSGNEIPFALWIMAAVIGLGTQWSDGRGVGNGFAACVTLAGSFLAGRYFGAKLILPSVLHALAAEGKLPIPEGESPASAVQTVLAEQGHQMALAATWVPTSGLILLFLGTGMAITFQLARGSVLNVVSMRIDRWQALKILEREANVRMNQRKMRI